MRIRITGILAELNDESAVIERDGFAFEILVPRYALIALAPSRGQSVTLHTYEYLEGSPGGGNLLPRLIGFADAADRDFFHEFTSVKGIGIRRALRAMVEPVGQIAADIEAGDTKAITRLPGVGPRAAQTIVAELQGKLKNFAHAGRGAGSTTAAAAADWTSEQRDAIDLLVTWGDNRIEAERLIKRAAGEPPQPTTVEEWVRAAYRARSTVAK